MHNNRAVAQASVLFFYLLTRVLLIAFVEKLVPDLALIVQKEEGFNSLIEWQLLFRKSNYFLFCGK
jgi:hypothetical protein